MMRPSREVRQYRSAGPAPPARGAQRLAARRGRHLLPVPPRTEPPTPSSPGRSSSGRERLEPSPAAADDEALRPATQPAATRRAKGHICETQKQRAGRCRACSPPAQAPQAGNPPRRAAPRGPRRARKHPRPERRAVHRRPPSTRKPHHAGHARTARGLALHAPEGAAWPCAAGAGARDADLARRVQGGPAHGHCRPAQRGQVDPLQRYGRERQGAHTAWTRDTRLERITEALRQGGGRGSRRRVGEGSACRKRSQRHGGV